MVLLQPRHHFRQPLQTQLLPVIPALIATEVAACSGVKRGGRLLQGLQCQGVKIGHAIGIGLVAAGRIAMLFLRGTASTQNKLYERIPRRRLQQVLFVQRQLQEPDIMLAGLLRIPAQDTDPGMLQVRHRPGLLLLFKGHEVRQRHFCYPPPHIQYPPLRTAAADQFSDGHRLTLSFKMKAAVYQFSSTAQTAASRGVGMSIIFAVLAGFIMGAGLVGWQLSRRWQQQVREAEQSLQDIADQHQQEIKASKALKQQVADLQFQLNQARNEIRALQPPANH